MVSFERFNTGNCQRALHNIDFADNNHSYYLYLTTNLIGIFLLFISLINLVIDSFNQVYYCIALNSSITDCISCIFVLSYCQSSRVGGGGGCALKLTFPTFQPKGRFSGW